MVTKIGASRIFFIPNLLRDTSTRGALLFGTENVPLYRMCCGGRPKLVGTEIPNSAISISIRHMVTVRDCVPTAQAGGSTMTSECKDCAWLQLKVS